MEFSDFEEQQPEVQPRSKHNVVQTLAAVVTALSAVAAANGIRFKSPHLF